MTNWKLNVCAFYNPLDPRTWSGTPYNISSVLDKMGKLGEAYTGKPYNRGLELLSKCYYKSVYENNRGLVYRLFNSFYVSKKIKKSKNTHHLHFAPLTLPVFTSSQQEKHYVYIDASWDICKSQTGGIENYSPKLIQDAEKFEKKTFEKATHIFTTAEYVRENLIEHYKIAEHKITAVGTGRGGIKPNFGKKDYSNGKILFVAKGRFEDKGGFLVLDAFKIAQEKFPHLTLTIVGQNEYTDNIKQKNVTTLGFVSLEKLQELFDDHSLFLMPSRYEPWGLVYLEALACKMPIAGLNKNSLPEISNNGAYGYLLDKQDPQLLADIIIEAMNHPEILEQKGTLGQKFCLEKFNWENTVSAIIETIEKQYL